MENEKRLIDANALPIKFDGHTVSVWKCDLDAAPTVDAVEVAQKPLRVEITTDDFTDKDLAKEKGYYRKHYFCPVCDIEIGHKTFDKTRQFGQGTLLHSNEFPNYCPNCGAKMDGGNEDGSM